MHRRSLLVLLCLLPSITHAQSNAERAAQADAAAVRAHRQNQFVHAVEFARTAVELETTVPRLRFLADAYYHAGQLAGMSGALLLSVQTALRCVELHHRNEGANATRSSEIQQCGSHFLPRTDYYSQGTVPMERELAAALAYQHIGNLWEARSNARRCVAQSEQVRSLPTFRSEYLDGCRAILSATEARRTLLTFRAPVLPPGERLLVNVQVSGFGLTFNGPMPEEPLEIPAGNVVVSGGWGAFCVSHTANVAEGSSTEVSLRLLLCRPLSLQ